MSKHKIIEIKSLTEVVKSRRHLKANGLVCGKDYVIETLHDKQCGYVTGYILKLDEELAIYYKIAGIVP